MEVSGRFPYFSINKKMFEKKIILIRNSGTCRKHPRPVSGGFQRFPDNPSSVRRPHGSQFPKPELLSENKPEKPFSLYVRDLKSPAHTFIIFSKSADCLHFQSQLYISKSADCLQFQCQLIVYIFTIS